MEYRPINAISIKDRYVLPLIPNLFNSMQGVCWLSQSDLMVDYHRISTSAAEPKGSIHHKTRFVHMVSPTIWPGHYAQPVHDYAQQHLESNEIYINHCVP
jgi:hypothetical protein